MKKKLKQNIAFAIIAAVIIGGAVAYNYSLDQAKIKGFSFGNELQQIQDDVKKLQNDFESKLEQWKEGELGKKELLENYLNNISELEALILRYDDLTPPKQFFSSVELFKLSSEAQLESYKEYTKWIETEDDSYRIRSETLIQESFEFEMAALAEYKAAQQGINP